MPRHIRYSETSFLVLLYNLFGDHVIEKLQEIRSLELQDTKRSDLKYGAKMSRERWDWGVHCPSAHSRVVLRILVARQTNFPHVIVLLIIIVKQYKPTSRTKY